MKTIVSLFDYTGTWSQPYKDAGYNVIQHDIQHGQDIFTDTMEAAMVDSVEGRTIHGLLAAVPCTDFAGSGARWWKEKDCTPASHHKLDCFDSQTEMSMAMVLAVLAIVEWLRPKWWCIENPIGRIHKLVPELGKPLMYFNPTDFGHPYTKRTALYGNFNTNLPKTPVLNLFGSEMWSKYGGKSLRTKNARSVTPAGFAQAFYEANK